MRSFEVRVAVMLPGIGRRSSGGTSVSGGCSCECSIPLSDRSPFEVSLHIPLTDVADASSLSRDAISRIHFGSRRTSSGIGSTPSGNGYCSRRCWRRFKDHGRKLPSRLHARNVISDALVNHLTVSTYPSGCCSSASPRSQIGWPPNCTMRLYSLRCAQLNLNGSEFSQANLSVGRHTSDTSCLQGQMW